MKLFIQLCVVGLIGFILFDTQSAIGLQITYLVGWLIACIPRKIWFELLNTVPSFLFWTLMLND